MTRRLLLAVNTALLIAMAPAPIPNPPTADPQAAVEWPAVPAARPPGGPGGPPGEGWHRRSLFISPMGEPFRGPTGRSELLGLWWAGADHDRDGKLTLTEFRADAIRWFGVLDSNHDGVITPDEVTFYETELIPELSGGFAPGGGGGPGPGGGRPGGGGRHGGGGGGGGGGMGGGSMGGGGGMGGGGRRGGSDDSDPSATGGTRRPAYTGERQGAARFGLLAIPEPVTGADADMNRNITPDEFAASAKRRFAMLDADGDGVLDRAELPDMPEGRPGGRRR